MVGDPSPATVRGRRGGSADAGQPQGVDPVAEQREHGRQQGDRGEHRPEHRGDRAVGERTDRGEREDQQPGHRGRDDDGRHDDGAPGGGDGRSERRRRGGPTAVARGAAYRQLFPEAVDHEQGVVDGQPQAQQRNDREGVDRDRGDLVDDTQRGERHDDRNRADDRGQPGRHDRAEDEHAEQHDERQGERFGARRVAAHAGREVIAHRDQPADVGADPVGLQQRPQLVVVLEDRADLARGQGHPDLHGPAVRADQARCRRGVEAVDDGRRETSGQRGHHGGDGRAEDRVVDGGRLRGVGHHDIRGGISEIPLQQLVTAPRVGCFVVASLDGQPGGDPAAVCRGPREQDEPDGHDEPGPPAHESPPASQRGALFICWAHLEVAPHRLLRS